MAMKDLYNEEELAKLKRELEAIWEKYRRNKVPKISQRYFTRLAEKYRLIEKLEEEIRRYQRGELGENSPTSNLELSEFFDVRHFSVQMLLDSKMDPTKRDIKSKACLKAGQENGWSHLRDSGNIPPLEGRVRDAAILAIKKKWGKIPN